MEKYEETWKHEIFSYCWYIFKSVKCDKLNFIFRPYQCIGILGRFIPSELNQGSTDLKSFHLQ